MNCIDLFSGCGGLSLGLKNAGFNVATAIDSDEYAINVYKENFPGTPAFCEDLTKFSPRDLVSEIGAIQVNVVAGGPPCQGFSVMRQLGGSNHGERLIRDSRRYLYRQFLEYVEFFKPELFLMENVPGIKTAADGRVFEQIIKDADEVGYRIVSEVINAWEFGIPQKRIRQIFFGTKKENPEFDFERLINPQKTREVTLWEAIGDLPHLKAGQSKSFYD